MYSYLSSIMYSMMSVVIIPLLLISIFNLFSWKDKWNKMKSSPFECGFEPMSQFRKPFSLRFFIILILFLIFDVELILLLPLFNQSIISVNKSYLWVYIFLSVLALGLIYEWEKKMLEWYN